MQWRPRRPFRPPGLGSSGPPRGPTPRERARPAAPKAPGRPPHGAGEPVRGRAPRRPRARPLWRAAGRCECAPGRCECAPRRSTPPAPRLAEKCTLGALGSRGLRHSPGRGEPGLRNRGSDTEGPAARPTAASEQPFGRERGGHLRAAVTSVIQTARQWRGRAAGSAEPRPAPPRGPSGRPRRKRSRGARRPYAGPIISRVGRGSGVLLYVSRQARFTDPRRRSRKGKILNTAHPGGFSLKRLCENALGAAAFLV